MITILMYHQIAEVSWELDPLGLAVPPDQFEQQMTYLARNRYRCLTLVDAVRYLRTGKRPPARSFVLTFDDGYQDVLTRACPILDKFGFTATVFLVAGRLGFPSNWWGQEGARSGLLLTPAESRELVRRGYILGSHTVNHPFLNRVDEQSAFNEIRNSRVLLQEMLDVSIDFFSYPFSETNACVESLVKAVGYTAACAGDSGSWNIFHLWRVPCLRDDTALAFALKVSGLYNQRTALRESTPGLLLRRSVHLFRRHSHNHHPGYVNVLNDEPGVGPQRRP
jgi:peptidoglycan/xylan/chitin deacetylase (PgdA/CDA1 family)